MNFTIPKSDQGRFGVIERMTKAVRALDAEKIFEVKIDEKKPKRSGQQNKYLFGVVYVEIARHLEGWDKDDIHEFCLGEWSGWEVVEGFGKKRQRPVLRSSKLNKQQFADYIDHIQRTMAERGIYIPDATE